MSGVIRTTDIHVVGLFTPFKESKQANCKKIMSAMRMTLLKKKMLQTMPERNYY